MLTIQIFETLNISREAEMKVISQTLQSLYFCCQLQTKYWNNRYGLCQVSSPKVFIEPKLKQQKQRNAHTARFLQWICSWQSYAAGKWQVALSHAYPPLTHIHLFVHLNCRSHPAPYVIHISLCDEKETNIITHSEMWKWWIIWYFQRLSTFCEINGKGKVQPWK